MKRQPSHELLIGHWRFVKEKDTIYNNMPLPPFNDGERDGYYEFINDSLVDTKRRYYKVIKSATRDRERKLLGTITKYEIVNDSLKLFNPSDSTWENAGLLKGLTDNKMILVSKWGKESTFLRDST